VYAPRNDKMNAAVSADDAVVPVTLNRRATPNPTALRILANLPVTSKVAGAAFTGAENSSGICISRSSHHCVHRTG
jgi:hypothetical protein